MALILAIIGIVTVYLLLFQKSEIKIIQTLKQKLTECLDENKDVSYKSEDKEDVLANLTIFINDRLTGKEIFSFKIDNVYRTVPRAELHKCGLYTIRFLNYDRKKTKPDTNFRVEIWKYRYDGQGEPFFPLSEGNHLYYSYVFRIDPDEKFIVLEKGYLGKDDYAIVVKDLNTKEDIFILFAKEIFNQYPNITGNFNVREWTKDGRYFWANIFVGANVLGFIRIDSSNWTYEVFPAPKDVLGGDALNLEKGLITVHPGNVWYGIAEITEEEKARRRAQGIGTELYIHNLFTGQWQFVASTTEPLWYFKPKWISDTELEYELPTGEKEVYKIK